MKKRIFTIAGTAMLGFAAYVCTIMFTACSSSDDSTPTRTNNNFAEKIMGKWMCTIVDEKHAVTNYYYVLTFVSPTKAYRSFSPTMFQQMGGLWENQAECKANIMGNGMTITNNYGSNLTSLSEYTLQSMTETDMLLVAKHTITYNGMPIELPEHNYERFKKITKDYSKDIIGTWEGQVTSGQSDFDDGKRHRWEYKADGTYVYYTLEDDGQWVKYDNIYANYFVDGVLLCSRWKNNGEDTENREWWEIETIANGVMKWTAIRKNDSGNTYTASFQMTKVK